MNIYTENKNDIIHETSVDFVLRPCTKEIHIVQYDKSLPIVKVELFKNGERYVLPENAAVNIRVGKLDHTFVYESILGTNDERNIVYFEISEQMALIPGKIWPVLEVIENEKIACSSPLCFIIERNPIQEGQIESHDHFPIIYEIQGTIADHELRISNLEQQVIYVDDKLNTKLDKVTSITDTSQVYAKLKDGKQAMVSISSSTTANNIVIRDSDGLFDIIDPIKDSNPTTKKYVDTSIQLAVEEMEIRSDVIDILGTYQDLQNYDTSNITINDLIKIISDETHNNATSYYRWQNVSGTNKWNFVASEGPYYTISKSEERFVNISDYQEISGEKWFTNIVTISHLFFKSIGDEEAGPAITYDSDYYGWFYNRVLSINIGTNELGFIQPEYYDGKTNRIEYVTPNQIRLLNIADPISETDVSNKRYADRKLELHTFNGFVGGSQVHEQIQNGQTKYCQSGTQTSVDPSQSPIINIELTQEHISSISNKKAVYIKKIHIEYELDSEIGVNKTWEYEFNSRIFGSGSASDDINPKVVSLSDMTTGLALEWTLIYRPATGKQYYGSYNITKGQQFGSNTHPSDYISLYTTSIQNATIKNMWVEVSGNSGTTAKIKLTLVQDQWTVNNIADPTITTNNEQYIFYHEGGTHLGAGSGEIIEYNHIFLKKENDVVTSIVAKSEYLYIEEDLSKESDTYRLYKYIDDQMQEVSKTRLGTTSDTAYRGDYGQDNYNKLKEVREQTFTFYGEKTFGNGLNIQNDVNHDSYNISTSRIDQEYNIDELQIRKKGDTYSLLSVVAPTQDPKEATLALKVENSGANSNETYFMDISVMNYMNPDEDPEESIYIQSRNASVKPNFNIGYTDETQTRHKKFIITHDALPIMLNNTGVWIKNTNDKSIHSWADRTELSLEELQKIKNISQIENNITQINSDLTSEIARVDNNITQINSDLTSEIARVDNNIATLENRKVDVGEDSDQLRIYSFGKFDGSIYHNIIVATSYTDLNLGSSYGFIPNIKFLNESVVRLEPKGINQNYDSGVYQIYGHMPLSAAENKRSSLEYCFNVSNTPNPAYIPQYNVDGRLKSNDPVDNDDVVNKRTLNSSFNSITGSTKCKITYNSKGLVTAGADLASSDIPSLDASKITSGTFPDARIANAINWNAKTKVTLNGTIVTYASIYAPITSGTSGQYLKSNGSGTPPTWVSSGEILGGYTFELNLQEGGAIRPNVHLSIVAYKSDGTHSTHDLYSSSELGATNIKLYNVVAVKIQCVSMGSGNYAYNTVGSGNVFGTIINPGITKIWDFASISGLGNGDQADLLLLGDYSCTIVYETT